MSKTIIVTGISGYQSSGLPWQESTGFTPAEIALGRKLKGPIERALTKPPNPSNLESGETTVERQESLIQLVKETVQRAQAKQRHYYILRRKQAKYKEGDLVWVRTHPLSKADDGFMAKLSPKWKGPAKVCKCLGPVNYTIYFIDNPDILDTFHVQNSKSIYGSVQSSTEEGDI